MPQGKLRVKAKKPASTKTSKAPKKGAIRKKKPALAKKKKMQKVLESTFNQTIEKEIREKAGMSSKKAASAGTGGKGKGKKKK